MTAVFLFPGQGSQYVGMGAAHKRELPELADYIDMASQVLGEDLGSLMVRGPRRQLMRTDIAQVAIFTLSCALFGALSRTGETPVAMAGHSLGQFSALVAAGAMDFITGLRLVAERGRLMHQQNMECDGTMLAVNGLSSGETEKVAADIEGCWIGNYNAPKQQILSGLRPALQEAEKRLCRMSAKVVWLDVAGAYHTPLFKLAARRFARLVREIDLHDARVPIIANSDARLLYHADDIRSEMINHMLSPVRWAESMAVLNELKPDFAIEIGPGKVLTGLSLRCNRSLPCLHTDTPRDLSKAVKRLEGDGECESM